MRVGLFGGSFNPIHLGHLPAAEEDREALGLALVFFVPAAPPPHKAPGALAPAEHRLARGRPAPKGNRHFMASDVEIRRTGSSYTIDTIRYFLATLRQPASLYLLMGADQFAELDTWKDCDELVRLSNIAVHTRFTQGEPGPPRISVAGLKRFGYTQAADHYVHSSGQTHSFFAPTFFPI